MAKEGINNVTTVVVLKPSSPTTDQLVQTLSSNPLVDVIQTETPTEAVQAAIQTQPCIVIASIPDPKAAMTAVALLKGIFPLAKKGRLKSMVISSQRNPQLRVAAQKLMVAEFIEEPIAARTLQFKANLQVRAIDAIKKRDSELKAQEELIEIKQGEQAKGKEVYAAEAKMKPMVNIDKDAFTFKGSKVKKQDGKTLFDLGGPDPESGEWKEHDSKETGKTQWRWVPKDPAELAEIGGEKGKDGWIADGDKPVFDPLKKKWACGGVKPELGYYKDGRKIATKVETNAQGELEVAEDSPQAEEKVKKSLEQMVKRAETNEKTKKEKAQKELADKQNAAKEENAKKADAAKEKAEAEAGAKAKDPNQTEAETEEPAVGKPKTPKAKPELGKAGAKQIGKGDADEAAAEPGDAAGEKPEKSKADRLAALKNKLGKTTDGDGDGEEAGASHGKLDHAQEEAEPGVAGELRDKRDGEAAQDSEERRREATLAAAAAAEAEEEAKDTADLAGAKVRAKKAKKEAEAEALTGPEIGKRRKDKDSDGEKLAALRNRLGGEAEDEADEEPGASHGKLDHAQEEAEPGVAGELRDKRKQQADVAALEKKKRAVQDEIQAEMAEPIPEKLTAEERAELEAETGSAKGALSDKDLARKAKLGRLKNLKKKLQDTTLELEQAGEGKKDKGGFAPGTIKHEEAAGSQSQQQLSPDEEKSKWQARDSDQDGEDVEWQAHKSQGKGTPVGEPGKVNERTVFYVNAADITTEQPAWERSNEHYVCIGAETRYRGFEKLDDLMPLWVYGGPEKPEFLEKEERWRFYDVKAERFDSTAALPADVRVYLLDLNEQVQSAKNAKAEAEEEAAIAAAAEKIADKQEALADLKRQLDEDPEPPADAGPGFDLEAYKRERKEKLEAKAQELQAEIEQEEAALAKAKAEHEERQEARENANTEREAARAEAEAEAAEEAESEDFRAARKKKQKEEDAKAEEMAELREKLVQKSGRAPREEEPTLVDELHKKVRSADAAEFLRKRQERKDAEDPMGQKIIGRKHSELEEAREKLETKATTTPAVKLGDAIAVNLLVSDALFDNRNLFEKPDKLLKTIADRFLNCRAVLLSPSGPDKGKVVHSSDGYQPAGAEIALPAPAANPDALVRLHLPILNTKTQAVLGYLLLEPITPRERFEPSDEPILATIVKVLSDYWTHIELKAQGGKAA